MASRSVFVEIVGDSKSLERAFGRSGKAADKFGSDLGKTFRGVLAGSGAFHALGRSIGFASAAFLGGAGLTAVIKSSVDAASNLVEQTNKVNVVFGDASQSITQFAKNTAESIGIASDQALEAAGTFGNLFTTVGLAADKNAEMSKSLVQLAADLASFNNASPEEALDALRSGLIGEAEPLRRFGILLSESRVQQEAMRQTGIKTAAHLTNQQKLLARYSLILKDSTVAQGDFARTADGLANAQRSLSAEVRDTQAALGTALLPAVRSITVALRDWLGDERNQRKLQADFNTAVRDGTKIVQGLTQAFQVIRAALKPLVDLVGGLKNAVVLLGVAFAVTKGRALAASAGFTRAGLQAAFASSQTKTLAGRLKSLPTKIGISIVIGTELFGPAKKLFEQAFGANFKGLTGAVGDDLSDSVNQRAIREAAKLRRAGSSRDFIRRRLLLMGFSEEEIATALGAGTRNGEDVRLRAAANRAFEARKRSQGAGSVGLSLPGRLSRAELQLALAGRTKTQADDRKALKVEEQILREMIASHKKKFADKKALNEQLTQIINQIQAIDDAAAKKRLDAQKKADDKAQKARDKEAAERKKAAAKAAAAARKESQEVHRQAERLRDLITTERERIGELFAGPIFNPTEAQQKRALGAPTPGSNAKQLVADLRAQINQFKSLERDLQTLARRGAPPQLLAELRNQGLAAAPQIHALATAGGGTFSQFKQLFIQRDRLAVQAAKQERPINVNLTVNVNRDTGAVKVVRTTPHGQTRGRNPGVPTSIGSFVNP